MGQKKPGGHPFKGLVALIGQLFPSSGCADLTRVSRISCELPGALAKGFHTSILCARTAHGMWRFSYSSCSAGGCWCAVMKHCRSTAHDRSDSGMHRHRGANCAHHKCPLTISTSRWLQADAVHTHPVQTGQPTAALSELQHIPLCYRAGS